MQEFHGPSHGFLANVDASASELPSGGGGTPLGCLGERDAGKGISDGAGSVPELSLSRHLESRQ